MKDPTDFRERVNAYKNGEMPYENGLPKYARGKRGFSQSTRNRIDDLYKLLQAKGFDAMSAAGIIGNALLESSLDPDSVNQFGYSGIFQNSKQIREAIENQYGDYSLLSQLRYLDDWTSGNTWVKRGKYKDYTATGAGSFLRAGYKTVQDASDAFMKLYERPVIMKDGKIIGYQDHGKRRDYSQLVYDYITGGVSLMQMPQTQILQPVPITSQPDATRVSTIVPQQYTTPTYNTEISPYISGKPMLRLTHRVQLPSLLLMMQDSEFDFPFSSTNDVLLLPATNKITE